MERINVIVAETSPIIRTGISHCLAQITSPAVQPLEVRTAEALNGSMISHHPSILIVNPSFCGAFSPAEFRARHSAETKLMAIEIAPLGQHTRALYDEVLNLVTDDQQSVQRKIAALATDNKGDEAEREQLSPREREIVAHVVRGLTNKEIADRLFLSPYTVITHRRNIARKLDIHSPTGLTIYAIVNKLVDISDIRI